MRGFSPKRIQGPFRALWRDDSAQATVEYMLMLAISVALVSSVIKKFIKPYLIKYGDALYARIQSTLFNKANMHSLKIGGH